MKMRMYSVYDKKALSFDSPMLALNEELAMRYFREYCRSSNRLVSEYPDDFDLYELGFFDLDTGKAIPHEINHFVTSARCFFPPSDVSAVEGSEASVK